MIEDTRKICAVPRRVSKDLSVTSPMEFFFLCEVNFVKGAMVSQNYHVHFFDGGWAQELWSID